MYRQAEIQARARTSEQGQIATKIGGSVVRKIDGRSDDKKEKAE